MKQFENITLLNRAKFNQEEKLLTYMKEVPGSNQGRNTRYSDSGFLSVYQKLLIVE
jgi:hypothetical protein